MSKQSSGCGDSLAIKNSS